MDVEFDVGLQRIIKVVGTGIGSLSCIQKIVYDDRVFEPDRADLPLVRMSWGDRNKGFLVNPERWIGSDEVPTTYQYAPKYSGTHTGDAGLILEDNQAAFYAGDGPVVVGDKVRNLTTEEIGEVVAVLDDSHQLQTSITFSLDDEYDVHWPVDVLKRHVLDRKASLSLDLYCAPRASYASGKSIDLVERAVMAWFWLEGYEALNDVYAEVVTCDRASSADGIIATGLGADFYRRSVIDIELNVGDGGTVRKPTVQTVATTTPSQSEAPYDCFNMSHR